MSVHAPPVRRDATRTGVIVAAIALLSVVPLLIVNHIVVFRIDPVFSWIRPGEHTSPQEIVLLWSLLGLLVVGAVIAMVPVLRGRARGWWIVPNAVVAAVLLTVFVLLAVALGNDLACAPTDNLCD